MIVFSGTSDANGQFVAAGLPVVAGTLHWSAVARGTGRGFGTHPKRDGDAPIAIVARLDPGSTLIGQVVDDAGRPVSGAPLRVAETDGPWAEATQSDATGQFRVAGAPHEAGLALGVGGDWVLVNGQEVVPVLTPKQGDPALVRLVVEPAGAISGRVTGAGRELARATIVATATDRALAATRETVSGADGSFTFRGLRSTTTWEIEARHPKYAPAFVERVSASTRGLELRLAAGGAITGRVIDGAHRAYRGVEVYAQRVSQTGSEIVGLREYASVRSDADGTFLLDHLNPGPYRVEYRAPAHMQFAPTATVLRQADVVDAAVTTLDDAQIGRGGRLHIVVQANATPQWLTVSILPTGQGGAPHQAQLWGARNGAFEMEDVAPGVYDISGQSRDIGHARAPAVRVEPDTTTELVLPFAAGLALHGSVVDARGRPIAGARVDAYLATSGSQQTHSIPGRAPDNFSGNWTFSQDDGSFHLAGLVAGAHTLRVSKADQPPIERTVAVAPNAPALEVRLPDPARLAVLIPGGARGADKVVLAETDDGGGHHASAITDPRGTAQFEALPPGKYQVKAIIADAPVKTIVLRAGESKQITLEVTQ
jgi:protocatechuate 3,4-dioxygenase beta subunit